MWQKLTKMGERCLHPASPLKKWELYPEFIPRLEGARATVSPPRKASGAGQIGVE